MVMPYLVLYILRIPSWRLVFESFFQIQVVLLFADSVLGVSMFLLFHSNLHFGNLACDLESFENVACSSEQLLANCNRYSQE